MSSHFRVNSQISHLLSRSFNCVEMTTGSVVSIKRQMARGTFNIHHYAWNMIDRLSPFPFLCNGMSIFEIGVGCFLITAFVILPSLD